MNSFPGGAPMAGGALGPAEREASLAALRATTGYSDLKEFQRVDVVVSPYAGN